MLRIIRLFSLTLMLTSLMGCITFPRKAFPEKNYYVFNLDREATPSLSKTNGILAVNTCHISTPFDRREFVYRKGISEYESDFYNEFLSTPESIITEQLRLWLFDSGLFQNVVRPSSNVSPTHILEGNVTELYADYRQNRALQSIIGLRFTLIDDTKSEPKILFQKQYAASVDISTKNPNELVAGWSKGLKKILTEFESDLSKLSIKYHE